jgi:hypothetical protein
MHDPRGNYESFAGSHFPRRLTRDHQRRLTFGDVADFVAGVRVPAGNTARSDFDPSHDGLAFGHRHVGLGDDCARQSRILRNDEAGERE